MPKSSQKGATVSKALNTLELLAMHESLRVSDIGRELNIAISTAHRLLSTLRAHGYADQDPLTRKYRLGYKAIDLGRGKLGETNLIAAAHQHIEQLSAEVNETVNLIILDGPDALFIDGVESRHPVRVATRTGARIPAYTAAGGKALLAYLPPTSVRARYPEGLIKITEHTISDLESLEKELSEIRKLGYALNIGEHLSDVCAIGVAIEGNQRSPLAAVTVAGPRTRWDREQLIGLVPQLIEVSKRIEKELADSLLVS